MNWLVYHIASGQAFFTGIALVIIAALASTQEKPIAKRISMLAFLLGIIAIAVSSTAIPYPYYGIALIVTIAWMLSRYVKHGRRWIPYAVVAAWAIAAAVEIPYHIVPVLQPASHRAMTVIGDSVTAGMGANDPAERWPILLAKEHDLSVQDISHMGETTASALKRAQDHSITSPVVLLEIGGNDLLGSTSVAQFSRDLDALLAYVAESGRQVVMLELPLPPFHHEYGRVQRSLAHKHQVLLVPKRVFLSVLAADDSTLDTIHLTQTGHQHMAACVWRLVKSAFPNDF